MAGVRAGICMIAVPALIRVVRASTHAAAETASDPYASEVQTESKPRRSASSTRSIGDAMSAPEYPSTIPSFILFLGWQDFLRAHLIDQMLTAYVNEVSSLLVIREICSDTPGHQHHKGSIIHIKPVGP